MVKPVPRSIVILKSLLTLITLSIVIFFVFQKYQNDSTQNSTKVNSPFGKYVSDASLSEIPKSAGNPTQDTIDYNKPVVTDYLTILGISSDDTEPGKENLPNKSQVNNPLNYTELGYINGQVSQWEVPDIIRLISIEKGISESRDYIFDCGTNTLQVSKKDNKIVSTGFKFTDKLEKNATVFMKCVDDTCTRLGDACIIIK